VPQGVLCLWAADQESGGKALLERQQEVCVDYVNQRPLRTNLQLGPAARLTLFWHLLIAERLYRTAISALRRLASHGHEVVHYPATEHG
jgi:hypothetical protein